MAAVSLHYGNWLSSSHFIPTDLFTSQAWKHAVIQHTGSMRAHAVFKCEKERMRPNGRERERKRE